MCYLAWIETNITPFANLSPRDKFQLRDAAGQWWNARTPEQIREEYVGLPDISGARRPVHTTHAWRVLTGDERDNIARDLFNAKLIDLPSEAEQADDDRYAAADAAFSAAYEEGE